MRLRWRLMRPPKDVPPVLAVAGQSAPADPSALLEPLLAVHSAPSAAWLADAAYTAAERGLGALYALLYLRGGSGHLDAERPASSERMRGLAKLNQAFQTSLTSLDFDPEGLPATRAALEQGRAQTTEAIGEALPVGLASEAVAQAQRKLGVERIWLAPLLHDSERLGMLVLFMPSQPSASLEAAELLGRHCAVAYQDLREKEAGRKWGELDAVRWVYDERRFQEQLAWEISRARRHKRPLSLLLVRVENVAELRARFGRFLSEHILRQVGATLQATMRHADFLGAYQDEGFALILVEADQIQAQLAEERICSAVEKISLESDLPDLKLETVYGTSTLAQDGETAFELLAAADARLTDVPKRNVA